MRYMCDDLAVMFNGRMVEFGSVEDVIGHPEHPYTRSLLAAVPEIGERRLLSDSALEAAIGDPAPPGGCDYHLRCPIGPIADPARTICATQDPVTGAPRRLHRAGCHFALAAPGSSARAAERV